MEVIKQTQNREIMKTPSFLLLALICISSVVHATHFAGADLTYRCLGGNSYEITLSFYRDCSGVPEPTSAVVDFSCTSNPQLNFQTHLPKIPSTCNVITPGCYAVSPVCTTATVYKAIQECVYRTVVTLPPCNFWRISYGLCCRNPNNTVSNPTSHQAYVEATLNNLAAPCNSSPVFTNKPILFLCSNQPSSINHGALDIDGDSLSYELTPPKTGATSNLPYLTPYSYSQPLNSFPLMQCNPVSGTITVNPVNSIVTVMAIMVKQWRTINGNPVMIGSVMRDLQTYSIACFNTHLPSLSGMDFTLNAGYHASDTSYFREVCLGDSIHFHIWGYDPDTANPLILGNAEVFNISWNNGIPQGNFSAFHNGTDSAYASFSWKPALSDVSNIPRCFTATIKDEACPFNGTNTYSYCFVVKGIQVSLPPDTFLCQGKSITIHAQADTNSKNFIWRINGQLVALPLSSDSLTINTANYPPGTLTVDLETNDGNFNTSCPGKAKMRIEVGYQPTVSLGNDTTLCEGSSIHLDAGHAAMWQWSTGAYTQIFALNQVGKSTIWVNAFGAGGCTASDTITVEILPMPDFSLGPDTCSAHPFTFGVQELDSIHLWHYRWNDLSESPEIYAQSSGFYMLTVTAMPGSHCYKTQSRKITILDLEDWAKANTGVSICKHQSHIFLAPENGGSFPISYSWSVNSQALGTGNRFEFSVPVAGIYSLELHANGCKTKLPAEVRECPLSTPNIITPNGDGYNDFFVISNLEYYPGSDMQIFNRWGKRVFESPDYLNNWDAAGHADGVYFFILTVNDPEKSQISGSVTVMRGQ